MIERLVALLTLGAMVGCVSNPPQPQRDSGMPVSLAASARNDTATIEGACPFECCHYGAWTLVTAATLRAAPDPEATVIARLPIGMEVRADSGIVIMNPVGLAVAVRDFQDPDTRLTLHKGDTLTILNNEGEGFIKARLRDSMVDVTIWSFDSASIDARQFDVTDTTIIHTMSVTDLRAGLRLVRPPGEYWWAHFIVGDTLRGWVLMDSVEVDGADACG